MKSNDKTITLQEAHKILETAHAVVINDCTIVNPLVYPLNGKDSNMFLYLNWEEGSLEYSLGFNEGDNKTVRIIGSSMFLYDVGSNVNDPTDDVHLTLLVPIELEADTDRYQLIDLEDKNSNKVGDDKESYTYEEMLEDIEEWNQNMGTCYMSRDEFNDGEAYWRWERVKQHNHHFSDCCGCRKLKKKINKSKVQAVK